MAETSLKLGDRVVIITNTPQAVPVKGTVRVLNDPEENPGQQVGVELDEWTPYAHSLDGVVEEREQGDGQPVIGKGWWARPENLEKVND